MTNLKELNKDFDNLLKKYNIKEAICVLDVNSTYITIAESIDKKKEKELSNNTSNLFQFIGLEPNHIKTTLELLKQSKSKYDVIAITETMSELSLSTKDKIKLDKIIELKTKAIKAKNYELASKYRQQQRKLLGLND